MVFRSGAVVPFFFRVSVYDGAFSMGFSVSAFEYGGSQMLQQEFRREPPPAPAQIDCSMRDQPAPDFGYAERAN